MVETTQTSDIPWDAKHTKHAGADSRKRMPLWQKGVSAALLAATFLGFRALTENHNPNINFGQAGTHWLDLTSGKTPTETATPKFIYQINQIAEIPQQQQKIMDQSILTAQIKHHQLLIRAQTGDQAQVNYDKLLTASAQGAIGVAPREISGSVDNDATNEYAQTITVNGRTYKYIFVFVDSAGNYINPNNPTEKSNQMFWIAPNKIYASLSLGVNFAPPQTPSAPTKVVATPSWKQTF